MGTTTQALLTFEEFERLPESSGKQELLRGELIELPFPTLLHDRIAVRMYRELDEALIAAHALGEALDLGEALPGVAYRLGGHSCVRPDVSVSHGGQSEGDYFEGAPAIAIEVISPSNTLEAMDAKVELYFEFGAREVWQMFPKTRKVMVYRGSPTQVVTYHDTVTTPLIPGLAMKIAAILA